MKLSALLCAAMLLVATAASAADDRFNGKDMDEALAKVPCERLEAKAEGKYAVHATLIVDGKEHSEQMIDGKTAEAIKNRCKPHCGSRSLMGVGC